MQPPPPPPSPDRSFAWPIAINLVLLVLATLAWGTEGLPFVVGGLVLVNVVAAIIMALSKRMHFVPAFLLAGLVVGLVGFGACVLMLSGVGGQH